MMTPKHTNAKPARSRFGRLLADAGSDPAHRRWLVVAYDQLSDAMGPLAREDPRELGIILVESRWKAARRPYHKQKLAHVLANQRHFALEQARRGVAVRYVHAAGSYGEALAPLVREPLLVQQGPIRLMRPAERELRADLAALVRSGALEVMEHPGWLTTRQEFEASQKGAPWRMDAFYRHVRKTTGILMERGKPVGGKWSFDAANRKPWPGSPLAAEPPRFGRDEVKDEVAALIEAHFAHHPGRLDMSTIAATRDEAQTLWSWAKRACLPYFGPYEDAMSTRSRTLFHTRISALLNSHRLLPAQVVGDVASMDLPLESQEGFIRQVLGWREFVRHVHEQTDGFRVLPPAYRHMASTDAASDSSDNGSSSTGACISALGAHHPLPPAFWGQRSGLACLDQVVTSVWEEAYSHHITRLMVLCNLAALLDISPRELTDWFWVAYIDAYDWVVEPNVLGMGTYAAGDLMITKPYVSGAPYIDKMSDYCTSCAFDPEKSCPITHLYWAYLDRHKEALQGNIRMAMPLRSLAKRADSKRRRDRHVYQVVLERLQHGKLLTPDDFV